MVRSRPIRIFMVFNFYEVSQNSGQLVYLFDMKHYFLVILMLGLFTACSRLPKEDALLLENLMKSKPEQFQHILDSADFYEVQVIYTQINRDHENQPTFKTFSFNLDSSRYFYPASTVKLPAVLLALEKLRALNIQHLDKDTPMLHDSVYSGQVSVRTDTTSANNMASVAHYAKKILVVSDNDAYNRLYEFIGQEDFNSSLQDKGYKNTRILHRLERALSPDENVHTEAIRFFQKHGAVYEQPMLVNKNLYTPKASILKGKGYMKNDSLMLKPFDFTYKNFFPLNEQQRMLQTIIFPESVPVESHFQISEEDRVFVLQYMSQLPTETSYPTYYLQPDVYSDAYCKFLMFGGEGLIPRNIRIFNKVGDAYGFLIDNAYIVDFDTNIEFMLSAVIHVNKDGIYNDGRYEYESIGQPFLKNLGNLIYQYEVTRKREHHPNLSAFKFEYDRNR